MTNNGFFATSVVTAAVAIVIDEDCVEWMEPWPSGRINGLLCSIDRYHQSDAAKARARKSESVERAGVEKV